MKINPGFVLPASLALMSCHVSYTQVAKPNIILILTDDMGYSDISCYGGKLIPTSNIDKLAEEGIRFTQYYSASPICSPSRTGLLTGMHPAKWNITSFLQTRKGNSACGQADYLSPAAPSVARALKTAGYATGHFGKWHMGGGRDVDNAPGIKEYGFDEYSSTWESPDPDPVITSTDWIWAGSDSIKRWERTGYFVDKTLDFLKRHKGQPCFINLWPDDVHTPWVPGQERFGLYPKGTEEERDLRDVLAEYDRQIGRLMDGLKKLGIDKNTIVIFTSDNGPLPAFNGSRSGDYRGSKLSLYEGGIRMPFIVRWPEKIKKPKRDDMSVISAADLFPSFCAIAGATLPDGFSFDGKDKSDVLSGNSSDEERTLFWEYGRNETAYRYPTGKDRSPNLSIREGKWKLLVNADGTDIQLYNLERDSRETTNIYSENTDIAEILKTKVMKWRITLETSQNTGTMPVIKPLFESALRDPSICTGPDGTYYLTGTTANNPAGNKDTTGWWYVNEGIRIWKSKDLSKWEPLGLVWSLDKDATWSKEFKTARGATRRALWAPEIFYLKGTFWMTYSMNYGGCGLLRSTSGKPEGPYKDVKSEGPLTGNIDASLFQDDDGKVYFVYQNGRIALMNNEMTGFVEEPRLLQPSNNKQVGFEGAFLTKYNGKYILLCAEVNESDGIRTYDCMSAIADNIYGPYGDRYLAIPHGGHNMLFKTREGKWMSTFFGSDEKAVFRERAGILPVEFDKSGRFSPLLQTSAEHMAK